MTATTDENERTTRKNRIDPKLDAAGWTTPAGQRPARGPFRTEEEETTDGPADYSLWLDGRIAAVVEAKKLTIGPQNALTQAERYARGLAPTGFERDGLRCPFLYSTNGEVIWFHDVRHPRSRSRRVARFHTPAAFEEMLGADFDAAAARAVELPHEHPLLRPYQKEANAAVERAIAERKRELLLAMATGTGKTYTLVSQIYRLMKSGLARRVLFLVDRRALAAQAVRAFSSFEAEPGRKFDQIYEVYSSKFQTGDFDDDQKFDPKVLPQKYLTEPKPGHAFVYVCTIQRMAIHILGRQAVFGTGEEYADDDAGNLDIPIHAFDVIVADECHRGYTAQEVSTWRATLEHFDAIKVGLTATPAAHTTAFFKHKVFEYGYERAVHDGYLVDYDAVRVRSDVRMQGLFLRQGENVEQVDPETGLSRLDQLEDEREYDAAEIERKVTAPESNRKIVEEIARYARQHEEKYGRFPKTLIFAAGDLPHTSHADRLVEIARDVFDRGEDFAAKITGRVDRPLKRIREFRNRPSPAVVVTVDLLSTGVDIPDLEFIVFLRPVKSRILFEQMIGRGTRKGERHTDKDHFTVFDCFDGTLLDYFKGVTGITAEMPLPPTRTVEQLIQDVWDNRDRDYNIGCLVKRLQRIDKSMSGEARDAFARWVEDGDLARFGRELPKNLRSDFAGTMKLLRETGFQELLVHYPRPRRTFVVAYEQGDTVTSADMVRERPDGIGNDDYIQAFSRYVRENEERVEAIRILLSRPREWSPLALSELKKKLFSHPRFNVAAVQTAFEARYRKALVDIISLVKRAADEQQPLYTAAERVERAFAAVTAGKTFTPEQTAWLDRIREHLRENLSIDREDFDLMPVLSGSGGLGAARRTFGDEQLAELIDKLNEALAA